MESLNDTLQKDLNLLSALQPVLPCDKIFVLSIPREEVKTRGNVENTTERSSDTSGEENHSKHKASSTISDPTYELPEYIVWHLLFQTELNRLQINSHVTLYKVDLDFFF